MTASEQIGQLHWIEGGGVTSAQGFQAAGIHAGFRANPNRLDLALVVADEPCAAAGVFTQNVFCAAPVRYCRHILETEAEGESYGCVRAVVVNSANANAATGQKGLDAAFEAARMTAQVVGCPSDEVLVASTGVIGVQLPLEPYQEGLPRIFARLSREGGADAATAIMTTDTYSKEAACSFSGDSLGYEGCTFTVGAMAKGSGMIMPNMATMIAVVTTDAPVKPRDLRGALKRAADVSFNKVTVDSDTSTNDTCIALASGAAAPAGAPAFEPGTGAFAAFEEALTQVNVTVTGARTPQDADAVARTVANSPLVKTAIAGHDANWGRIAAAAGRSGAVFRQEDVDISILGIPVCRNGLALAFDEEEALRRFEDPEVDITIDLGAGEACTISINGDYRT